jgi:hypothetical protein
MWWCSLWLMLVPEITVTSEKAKLWLSTLWRRVEVNNRAHLIFNLVARWRWGVSFRPRRFTSGEEFDTQWVGGWVLPGASLDMFGKRNISYACRNSNTGPPFLSLVSTTIVFGLWLFLLLMIDVVIGFRIFFGWIKSYLFHYMQRVLVIKSRTQEKWK